MLAHFARDVSQHIALTGQIDAKHRAWQHLRYRALGDDLRFLCHAVKCQRARKLQPTTNPSALVYAIVSTPLHRGPLKTGTPQHLSWNRVLRLKSPRLKNSC